MRRIVGLLAGTVLMLASAGAALGASDSANCVGQFSKFFAQGGGGTHRSDVARDFAHNARPAGANVYSNVARTHGNLDECFAQNQ